MITAIDSIPERYLEKLFPCTGSHWRYPEAKKLIETADLSGKMKEQMLFLLKKASRCRSLTAAVEQPQDFSALAGYMSTFRNRNLEKISLVSTFLDWYKQSRKNLKNVIFGIGFTQKNVQTIL